VTDDLFGRFELVLDRENTDSGIHEYQKGNYFNNRLVWWLLQFERRGARVLDLGANIGTFSLAAAAAGFRVIAVDASPKHADLLRRGVRRNDFKQVQVVNAAVSDRPGVIQFHPDEQWGMIAYSGMQGPTVEVQALTGDGLLDRVGWDCVEFIKMDIEGSEAAALRGMGRMLSRADAPVLLYESNGLTLPLYGESVAGLRRMVEGFGYRVYRLHGQRLQPAVEFQPEAVLDLIALKPAHERKVESIIDAAPDEAETVARVVREIDHDHPFFRGYIAGALSSATPSILAFPQVREGLDRLSRDPDESVRRAATWWSTRSTSPEHSAWGKAS
jgi:FkbM family methyltransferase